MNGITHKFKDEFQRGQFIKDVLKADLKKTWVATLKPYKEDRSSEQNRLSHAWYSQISRTLKEDTPGRVKGYCKLHFGVPILRAEEPDFCEAYDRLIKPINYETKIEIMSVPDWFPVTSLMNTEQLSAYLGDIQNHYAGRVDLRFPNEPPMI